MIRKRTIKSTIYVIVSLISVFMNLDYCTAANGQGAAVNIYGGNNTLNNLGLTAGSDGSYYQQKGTKRYKSSISTSFYANSKISASAYDKEGNNILNNDWTINNSDTILAGTWIGINITEEHTASYSVNVKSEEIKKIVKCHYEKYHNGYYTTTTISGVTSCAGGSFSPYAPGSLLGTCTKKIWKSGWTETTSTETGVMDYYEDYSCPPYIAGGWVYSSNELIEQPGYSAEDYRASLEKRLLSILSAAARASVSTPTGKIKYFISNDYDNPKYGELSARKVGNMNGSEKTRAYSQKFEYSPGNVCMNLLTSDVTYNDNDCNISNNKITIENKTSKNGKNYWHYFVPLNINSNAIYSLDILSNNEKIFFYEQCKNFMDDHPTDYRNYISPQNPTINFTGDIEVDLKNLINSQKKEMDGCLFSTKIIIPVKQEFYNEIDGESFKGFNFYYKPIEITNPFPNGLNDTSLWYDWNKSAKKDPDLTKSYNEVTYVAQISNVNSIRDYTQKYPYTTWENMYTSGISGFIEKEEMVKRLTDKNDIYKLGCGPLNESQYNKDGTINYLYRKWCDNS